MSPASSSPEHASEAHAEQPEAAPSPAVSTGSEPGEVDETDPAPSNARSSSPAESSTRSRSQDYEPSSSPQPEASSTAADDFTASDPTAPPLPYEPIPGGVAAPPLPAEPAPELEDDGWEAHWNPNTSSYWFYNRFTAVWQQENPRVPNTPAGAVPPPAAALVVPETQDKSTISNPTSVAGGYNPAIHGDYDENAWYAQNARAVASVSETVGLAAPSLEASLLGAAAGAPGTDAAGYEYTNGGFFNRFTGQWQAPEQGVERHTDEAKSRRQMNAFFDVDAAANMHDGRSLKAERAGKKPTKAELKAFKEKRKAKKEEKRRAWLRD
ncbi:hypothetical protein B0T25DRAFT_162610 [Lasiosphaeria hispida]|uniref:WW domain-containing protein n=1 Tax=Lasiosphaeria hispida TaxID=260671 RepID=A0AAJ0HMC1_9PEZI|nr:hypothetical protein B0T25DRAFT_162610 [Lasiosphaeria hispida]